MCSRETESTYSRETEIIRERMGTREREGESASRGSIGATERRTRIENINTFESQIDWENKKSS